MHRPGFVRGYPTGQPYVVGFQPEAAPDAIALSALSQQRWFPDLSRPFRYADLGCGHGLSLAAFASRMPHGRFDGYDVSPRHIASARRLIQETGLDNVTVHERDFFDLAGESPSGGRYDFILAHGIWSWVSPDTREALVRLLDNWLSPGGFLVVSYNARPYWNVLEPLRYVVRELMGPAPEDADFAAVRAATEAWLAEAGNDTMTEYWAKVSRNPDSYLVHDFGARHAEAFWPCDVADALAAAQLEFVGLADLAANFGTLVLGDAQQKALALGNTRGYPRAADDMARAQPFRADLYSRGAPAASVESHVRSLAGWTVWPGLPVPREGQEEETGRGRGLAPEAEVQIERVLSNAPLAADAAIAAMELPPRKAMQLLLLAVATGRVRLLPALSQAAVQTARQFNSTSRWRADTVEFLPAAICVRSGSLVRLRKEDATFLWDGERATDEGAASLSNLDFGT